MNELEDAQDRYRQVAERADRSERRDRMVAWALALSGVAVAVMCAIGLFKIFDQQGRFDEQRATAHAQQETLDRLGVALEEIRNTRDQTTQLFLCTLNFLQLPIEIRSAVFAEPSLLRNRCGLTDEQVAFILSVPDVPPENPGDD